MASNISFNIGVGIKAPISEGFYEVGEIGVDVSYPEAIDFGLGPKLLPNGLSTVFVVTWIDHKEKDSKHLRSNSHHRLFVIHKALGAINKLLQAYKLVRMGHSDSCGVRTIGIYDTLFYFSTIDGQAGGGLNVGWKVNLGDSSTASRHDPFGTTEIAKPHIATTTYPVARRFVRCYELLEHGFYSEAFIIAFSTMDDLVQEMLHTQLQSRGMDSKLDRDALLRGIKESRLKLYLGPLLKISAGKSIKELWGKSEKALEWLNRIRNDIAHGGYDADYHAAAVGIYASIKLLHTLHEANLIVAEFPVEFFRHAKVTASWTNNPPEWVPAGSLAESMDFAS